MPSIASLKIGQHAVIKDFPIEDIPLKLLEMGCLPGNKVTLIQEAPFKDPLYLTINGSHLAIRKEMACKIEIEFIDGETN